MTLSVGLINTVAGANTFTFTLMKVYKVPNPERRLSAFVGVDEGNLLPNHTALSVGLYNYETQQTAFTPRQVIKSNNFPTYSSGFNVTPGSGYWPGFYGELSWNGSAWIDQGINSIPINSVGINKWWCKFQPTF